MPPPNQAQPDAAAQSHRVAQAGLATVVSAGVTQAWGQFFDLSNLRSSGNRLAAAVESLTTQYGRSAAAVALEHYRNQRLDAGVTGRPRLPMPEPIAADDVQASVERALSPLYGSPTPSQVESSREALESSAERLVLDQSRDAVITAVHADPKARGWARVTEPGACYFCAMLASRGGVYRSEKTADFRAHNKLPNGTGGTCKCAADPFFGPYEPTDKARAWGEDWDRLKEENGGHLSLIQWRRAYEGRDGSGRDPLSD